MKRLLTLNPTGMLNGDDMGGGLMDGDTMALDIMALGDTMVGDMVDQEAAAVLLDFMRA